MERKTLNHLNLKVANSLHIFLTTPDEIEKYVQSNSSDNCIHQYNVKIWFLFIQNYKPLTRNQWLKQIKSIVKWVEKMLY